MYLAKAWMAKATGDPADLEAAKSVYDQFASNLDYNRHVAIFAIVDVFTFSLNGHVDVKRVNIVIPFFTFTFSTAPGSTGTTRRLPLSR